MSAGDQLSARREAECPFLPRRGVCPSRTAQHHCGSLALSSDWPLVASRLLKVGEGRRAALCGQVEVFWGTSTCLQSRVDF